MLEFLQKKRLAYRLTFKDSQGRILPAAQTVLDDLKRVSGINKGGIVISPVSRAVDPYATAYRAGQRDMYLRITGFLNLDEADHDRPDSAAE